MSIIRGCWTCRLRRKKCPEEQPICSRCRQLDVTCYGYGLKPSWMDGGTKEKEILDKIRKGVKVTTDGQRRARALRGLKKAQEHKGLKEQGEPDLEAQLANTCGSPGSSHSHSDSVTGADGSNDQVQLELPWSHDAQLESFLLMHYLDFVFPLQFPFYSPQPREGGRGWFLGLLMRAKPLYNTALTLAAYHHNLVMVSSSKRLSDTPAQSWFELERFYSSALQGLGEHVGDLSKKGLREGLKDSIEVLACVIQLIMFEVARGGFENWQTHLLAAPDIHPFLQTYCTHPSMPTVPSSKNSKAFADLSFIDHAAMEFFSSIIIYHDILACVSTGLRPQYADICAAALGDDHSKVQLQNIMGCRNWVMVSIREIAVLWDRKTKMVGRGFLNVVELRRDAIDIEKRLDVGLERLSGELSQVLKSGKAQHDRSQVIVRITQAYAHAAKVYLNVLVSGPNPDLPEIIESVTSTLTALVALPNPELLCSVVWPFCIAGCMAIVDERRAFRGLASAAGVHRKAFGSSRRALEVMEMCWKLRNEGRSCDWFDAMEVLRYRVLLV